MIKALQTLVRVLQAVLSCYAFCCILNKWRIERVMKIRASSSYKK